MGDEESEAPAVPAGQSVPRGRVGLRLAVMRTLADDARSLLPWSIAAGACSAFAVAGPAVWASLTGRLPGRAPFVVVSLLVALAGALVAGRCLVRAVTGHWPSGRETWATAPALLGVPLTSVSLVLAGDLLAGVVGGNGGTSSMSAGGQLLLAVVVAVLGTAWLALATTWSAMILVPGPHARRAFRAALALVVHDGRALLRFAAVTLGLMVLALAASLVVSLYLTALLPIPAVQALAQWAVGSVLGAAFLSLFLLGWRSSLGAGLAVSGEALATTPPAAAPAAAPRPSLRGAAAVAVGVVAAAGGLIAGGARTAGPAGADSRAAVEVGLAVSAPDAQLAVADARRATAEAAAAEAFRLAQSGDTSQALVASGAAVAADPASVQARLVDGMVNAVGGNPAAAEADATALSHLGASAESQEVLSYLPSVRGGGSEATVWALLDDPFLAYTGYPPIAGAPATGSSPAASGASTSAASTSGTPASRGGPGSSISPDPGLDAALSAWIRAATSGFGFTSSSTNLQQAGAALNAEEQIAAVVVPGAGSGSPTPLPGVSAAIDDALAQQVLLAASSTADASGMNVGLALVGAPGGTIGATVADELLVAADTYNQLSVELSGGGAQPPPFTGSAEMTQALQLAAQPSSPEQLKVDAGLWNLLGSQYATAAQLFAAAAHQDRADLTARTYEGYAYYELAEFPQALAVLPRAGGEATSSLNETLLGQSFLGVAKSAPSKGATASDARSAIHYLSAALAQDATPWLTWLGLGDAYTLAGEPKLAVSAYQSGLEAGNYDSAIAYPTFSAPKEGYGLTGGVQNAGIPTSQLTGRINSVESGLTSTTSTSSSTSTSTTSTTTTTVPGRRRGTISTAPATSTTATSTTAAPTTSGATSTVPASSIPATTATAQASASSTTSRGSHAR